MKLVIAAPRIIVNGQSLVLSGTFNCPFCGGSLGGYADEQTMEDRALVHTVPICDTFDRLEVEDFVHEAAKKLGLSPDEQGAN